MTMWIFVTCSIITPCLTFVGGFFYGRAYQLRRQTKVLGYPQIRKNHVDMCLDKLTEEMEADIRSQMDTVSRDLIGLVPKNDKR